MALRDQLTAGLVAGIAGAIVMEIFLFVMRLRGVPTEPVLGLPASSGGGIVAQVLIAVAWACGYAYLSSSEPQLVRRPLISGAVYGTVAYCVMEMLTIIDRQLPPAVRGDDDRRGRSRTSSSSASPSRLVVARKLRRV